VIFELFYFLLNLNKSPGHPLKYHRSQLMALNYISEQKEQEEEEENFYFYQQKKLF
jgi:hypothetical protein